MSLMRSVTNASDLRSLVESWRLADETIAFVPTMGALHPGHHELVRVAKERADRVVVSVYVNPLQFGEGEDFDTYPRTPAQDAKVLAGLGADVLWTPTEADMYPEGTERAERITPGPIGDLWEGAERPGHFAGVLTVVKRLVDAVTPDYLVMGQKDAQQLWLVTTMLETLAPSLHVVAVPTVRDEDGVALSSRNAYLSADQRNAAQAIPRALDAAGTAASPASALQTAKDVLRSEPLMSLDYVALVHEDSFEEIAEGFPARSGRMLIAVRVGSTRLIDNARLTFGQ